MLGNYLQQMTSADDIFRCIFFLALLGLDLEVNVFNSFIASGGFYHLLITFANILDPDQIQTVSHPDSVPERIFGKANFEKVSRRQNYSTCKELMM